MKKLIAMLTIAALLLGSMIVAIPSIASDRPTYTLTTELIENGTKLHATLEYTNDEHGVWGAINTLFFNQEALSPDIDSVVYGTVWSEEDDDVEVSILKESDLAPQYADHIGMIYTSFAMTDLVNNYKSGVVFEITFDVLDSTENFDLNLIPHLRLPNNMYNEGKLDVEFEYDYVYVGPANGTVETTAPETTTEAPVVTTAPETTVPAPVETTVPETTAPSYPVAGHVSYFLDGVLSADKTKIEATLRLEGNENVGLWGSTLLLNFNKSALAIDESSLEICYDVWTKKATDYDVEIYNLVNGLGFPEYVGNLWYNVSLKDCENQYNNGTLVKFTFDILDKNADFDISLDLLNGDEYNHTFCLNDDWDLMPVTFDFTLNFPSLEDETTVPETTTEAPVETTAPVPVETTVPAVETTVPAVETTAPAVDTTAPAVDTTAPAVDTTAPAVDTTAPAADTTAPETTTVIETIDTDKVEISASTDVLPSDAEVKVENVEVSDEIVDKLDADKVAVIEISATHDGEAVQPAPGGFVNVKLDVPSSYSNNVTVYVEKDGALVKVDAAIVEVDGVRKLDVKLSEFTKVYIVDNGESKETTALETTAPATTTPGTSQQTGDNMIFVIVIALVALVACGAVVVLRKKRLVK